MTSTSWTQSWHRLTLGMVRRFESQILDALTLKQWSYSWQELVMKRYHRNWWKATMSNCRLIEKFYCYWVMVQKIIGAENTEPQQQSLCYVFIKYSPSRKVSPSCGWQVGGFVIPLYPSKTMARLFMMQFAVQTDRSFVLISCCFAFGSFSLMIFRFSYGT